MKRSTAGSRRGKSSRNGGDREGFTLIEMAIVIVLLGILVSFGATLIGPLTARTKSMETKDVINADVDSVIGFALTNGRLPNGTEFPGVGRSANDAWGKALVYSFDNSLASSTSAICDGTNTNLTVVNGGTSYNNVAFVILSSGPNYNNQTAQGSAASSPTTITISDSGTAAIDRYPGDFNRPEQYDDIVKWVTLPELRARMSCSSASTDPDSYKIYNTSSKNYFKVNGGACTQVNPNNLIGTIASGQKVDGYGDSSCTTSLSPASMSFASASSADLDGDKKVAYDGSDR